MDIKKTLNSLENIITSIIKKNTFITVEDFIDLCLNHKDYGYYINRNPIGKNQDFITAPEISQLFGEMLGFWLIKHWQQLNEPYINLIELGPGKGTLMLDLINIIKKVPKLKESIEIFLLEINKNLIESQKNLLSIAKEYDIKISWIKDIHQVPAKDLSNKPAIVIANEFLDVFPIKQFKYVGSSWHEVVVILNKKNTSDSNFTLALDKKAYNIQSLLPLGFIPKDGMIFEYSPLAIWYIKIIADLISRNKGAAVFIDYGYINNPYTNTIQAIKEHKYTNFLNNAGKCDITSLVNFSLLIQQLKNIKLCATITTQEEFLSNLGILQRMNMLLKIIKPSQEDIITSGVKRILDKDNMGSLFKVLEFAAL